MSQYTPGRGSEERPYSGSRSPTGEYESTGVGGGSDFSETRANIGETARELKDAVQDRASETVDRVKRQSKSAVDEQKSYAADRLAAVGEALRHTADDVDEPTVSRFARQAAQRVDDISTYIREHDLGDVVGDFQDWARRNPALFLGGAFVAGFLIARFIKSSQESEFEYGTYSQGESRGRFGRFEEEEDFSSSFGSTEAAPSASTQYGSSGTPSPSPGMTEETQQPPQRGSWEEP